MLVKQPLLEIPNNFLSRHVCMYSQQCRKLIHFMIGSNSGTTAEVWRLMIGALVIITILQAV